MLIADLTVALRPDSPARMLASFDIAGFDEYADLYGRLVAQDMLSRVGDAILAAVAHTARCYRPRNTEFAFILELPFPPEGQFLAGSVAALSEGFAPFNLELLSARVTLPAEHRRPSMRSGSSTSASP